jgi:hypothetical protein
MRTITITAATALVVATAAGLIYATTDSAKDVTSKAVAKASESAAAASWRADRDTCHKAVLAQLKAPSTARWAGDDKQRLDDGGMTGPVQYVIDGHVDAENGFGAMIRLSYTCSKADDGSVDALVSQPE